MSKCALVAASLAALSLSWFVVRSQSSSVDAGTAVRMEIEDLVREAELVVEGRVLAAQPRRDERGQVRTAYTISVQRTYVGQPLGTRQIELPGGVMPDGSGTIIPGSPKLDVGEDALLFVSAQSPDGLRVPVGLAQGKFRVVRDENGALVLARTQVDLVLVDPRTGAATPALGSTTFDYYAVVSRIETAAAAKLRTPVEGR